VGKPLIEHIIIHSPDCIFTVLVSTFMKQQANKNNTLVACELRTEFIYNSQTHISQLIFPNKFDSCIGNIKGYLKLAKSSHWYLCSTHSFQSCEQWVPQYIWCTFQPLLEHFTLIITSGVPSSHVLNISCLRRVGFEYLSSSKLRTSLWIPSLMPSEYHCESSIGIIARGCPLLRGSKCIKITLWDGDKI